MTLKYLYGYGAVLKEVNGEKQRSVENIIVLTEKKDVYQHAEMRRHARIGVLFGGFVKNYAEIKDMVFFGESISCEVGTHNCSDRFNEFVNAGDWWTAETEVWGKKERIWGVTEKGHELDNEVSDLDWVKSSHAEMIAWIKDN